MSTTSPSTALPRRAQPAGRSHVDVRARMVSAAPLAGLLLLTAVIYLWGLSRNGTANQYYSAAIQAGTQSWKAFLFGSLDSSQLHHRRQAAGVAVGDGALGSRLRVLAAWSMLFPQALEGVAAVGAAVRHRQALVRRPRRRCWPGACSRSRRSRRSCSASTTLTRCSCSCSSPARTASPARSERARTRWLALAGSALGLRVPDEDDAGVPRPAGVRARLPRRGARRRCAGACGSCSSAGSRSWSPAAGGSRSSSCGPRRSRPYIGGSTDNSISTSSSATTASAGSAAGERPGGGGGGELQRRAGVLRLFNAELGGQISWLLPAALIALGAGVVRLDAGGAPRTDRARAALLLWGGWLIVTGARLQLHERHHPSVLHEYAGSRRSPRSPASAPLLWQTAAARWHGVALAAMLASPPARTRSCFWTGRRTGTPGCGASCSGSRSPRPSCYSSAARRCGGRRRACSPPRPDRGACRPGRVHPECRCECPDRVEPECRAGQRVPRWVWRGRGGGSMPSGGSRPRGGGRRAAR